MILQSLLDSALFGHQLQKEDGNHLRYWMRTNPPQYQEMMIQFIDSIHQATFRQGKVQFSLEDESEDHFEIDFAHLSYLMEMIGGSFAFCGTNFGKKQKSIKQALAIYFHLAKSICHHLSLNRIDVEKEEIQQLLRRLISHLSLAFTGLASFEQAYILPEVLKFYHCLVTTKYQYLCTKTWSQLIIILMGILQHIVKDTKSRKVEWIDQLKYQASQTIFLAFIYSHTQEPALWKTLNVLACEWTNENVIDIIILSRWRTIMRGISDGLMSILQAKRQTELTLRLFFETYQQRQGYRATLKVQQKEDFLHPIQPFVQYQPEQTRAPKSREREDIGLIVQIIVGREHVIYVWHRFLHIFEGSSSLYAYNRLHQQECKILSHFLKTVKLVIGYFLTHDELKVQKLMSHIKEVGPITRTNPHAKSLHLPAAQVQQVNELVQFDSLFADDQEQNRFFRHLQHNTFLPQGSILLKIFGKFLFPNADFSQVIMYQKISIKALRAIANLFTQVAAFGEYPEQAIKGYYRLLLENLKVSNSLKVIKIATKMLRSNLPYQTVLLEPCASTLLNEYTTMCKQLQIAQNTDLRRNFNIILVEFLCVYAGRASELYRSQLDSVLMIAVESFKQDKVSIDLFHKLSVIMLHCLKLGRIDFAVRAILEISIAGARKDPEQLVKYLKTSVDFILMACALIQGMIHQGIYFDPAWINTMFDQLLGKVPDFRTIILGFYNGEQRRDRKDHVKIQCQTFFIALLQVFYQLCILQPSLLDTPSSQKLIECINESFAPITETKITEFAQCILKCLNSYAGNVQYGRCQVFFNTDYQIAGQQEGDNRDSLYFALNKNTLIEITPGSAKTPVNPKLFIIVRNSFGLNVWQGTQQFQFYDAAIKQRQNLRNKIQEQEDVEERKQNQSDYLDDDDLMSIIKSDIAKRERTDYVFPEVKSLLKPLETKNDLEYLAWSMMNQIGVANTYSKLNSIQVLAPQQKEMIRHSFHKLDQIHFRNTVFINCFYVDGINDTNLVRMADPDYEQYVSFFSSLGVRLEEEDLKSFRYQHLHWMKSKFEQQKHNPKFWLNDWFYSSTIMQEIIYIVNNQGIPEDLKNVCDNQMQYQYYNGLIILWVNLHNGDLQNPLLPLILKQFYDQIKEKRSYEQQFLIIYAYSRQCDHRSNFYRVLTLQLSKLSATSQFDPYLRGPLLNYMCMHEEELKLFLLAFVVNSQRFQNYNHTDQIKKREREILKTIQRFQTKKQDLFELLTQ